MADRPLSLKDAVRAYVVNGVQGEKEPILAHLPRWDTVGPRGRVVYRGQLQKFKDPSAMRAFSTSTEHQVADVEFGGKGACVWTIQLAPGIRFIDVERVLGTADYERTGKSNERELLIEGGGDMKITGSSPDPCTFSATYSPHLPTREEILALQSEDAIRPDQPVRIWNVSDKRQVTAIMKSFAPGVTGGRRRRAKTGRRAQARKTRRGRGRF